MLKRKHPKNTNWILFGASQKGPKKCRSFDKFRAELLNWHAVAIGNSKSLKPGTKGDSSIVAGSISRFFLLAPALSQIFQMTNAQDR